MTTGRPAARAPRAMVASNHPLATVTGLEVLRAGGNAIDAGLAVNAVLDVTQIASCGFGGDGFILYWEAASGLLHAYNASGRAPALATPEALRAFGCQTMPQRGPLAVTVPGICDGWWQLHQRFGRLPWRELWQPAIGYARDGFPVSDNVAGWIANARPMLERWPSSAAALPAGMVPGERLRQPNLAATFEALAAGGAEAFYRGDIGAAITAAIESAGGLLRRQDFADHHGDWTQPVGLRYRGLDILVHGPNSQGWALPYMLGLVGNRAMPAPATAEAVHLGVECKRLAFSDRDAYNTDPLAMTVDVARLLDERYLAGRRALLSDLAMPDPAPGDPGTDTTYFCLVDAAGNALSVIQSLYMGFGSGFFAGETGVVLQNRGAYFSLDPAHANVIAPRKRTAHTLVSAMVLRDGRPVVVPGSMGGDGQPQILYQILTAMIDGGLDPQQAIELPRWVHTDGRVQLEARFGDEVVERLEALGHRTARLEPWASICGHAQVIAIDEHGLAGGADPRGDGLAAGY